MDVDTMINDLRRVVIAQRARAIELRAFPAERLLHRPSPTQWNALEIIEHLCLSSGIYVRGLEKAMQAPALRTPVKKDFTPGRLGGYFTRAMQPRADGSITHRMRTFRAFDPPRHHGASMESLDRFIDLCDRSLRLLDRARTVDLDRLRVTSSLGPIVRFKAGDALRFPIAHQERHFLQLERVLASAPVPGRR